MTKASVCQLKLQRCSVVVSIDAGSMIFEGEGMAMAEQKGMEGERTRGRRSTSTSTTSTNVVCSSRGALLLRSKFENALSLNRRSSSSSIHAPR